MTRFAAALGVAVLGLATGIAWGFTCPVVIKQAEDLIKKAEGAKLTADTRPLVDEAKKLLTEARAHHEGAKGKKDHADAVRKAKTAAAYAEEAIVLATP
jgi:ERCC4-related helicase